MKGKARYVAAIVVSAGLAAILLGCAGEAEPANLYEEIVNEGEMEGGTSADYPPYESIDEDGNFVGFDMELIREIGDRMGVEIEIVDMGFDALITALQEEKIDAIIAAMSGTPERRERVDFTTAYSIDPQVFLAQEDADIEISEPADAVSYKVAVQTGTSMDMFMTEEFVNTGEMPEENLLRYERADQAALDLEAGRVDLVYTNKGPASELVEQMDVKIVFETEGNPFGGNRIAVPKGETELLNELNDIIQEMLDDGTIDRLREEYLEE